MPRLQLYDFEAIWWRGKITFENETLTPTGTLEPYNPFRAYIPYGRATRREDRSLLYEFLKVNPKDAFAVQTFCERFGVLGPVEENRAFDSMVLKDGFQKRKPLREMERWSIGAHLHRKFGEQPMDPTPAMTPLTLDDFNRTHRLLRQATIWAQQAKSLKDPEQTKNARTWLCYVINYKLSMVRPRLNWNEQAAHWSTGWDLQSLEGALYLMLLLDVQSQGAILTCPWCHQIFLGDHPRTVFCSLRCQNAHKAKVFRDRHSKKAMVKRIKRTRVGRSI